MADDRGRAEDADVARVADRRDAVALDHLEMLEHPLRHVQGEGDLAVVGGVEAVAQQIVGAVFDLHGRDHAGQQRRRGMLREAVDEGERRLHALAAARLVPVEAERMIVGEPPARAGVARREEAAHAALDEDVGPAVVDRRNVAHRRDAALEQFAQRHFEARAAQRRIGNVEGLTALVEARHVHVGDAVLLADAAIDRLVARVRVDVDEAGHHHAAAPVDDRVRLAGEARPDVHDRIVGERHVDVSTVYVALGALLPGDHPVGVLDQGRDHGFAPFHVRNAAFIVGDRRGLVKGLSRRRRLARGAHRHAQAA